MPSPLCMVKGSNSTTNTTLEAATYNQNMSEFVQVGEKVFFAAADRNKDFILNQLKPFFEKAQLVLEIGSGSGQHVQHFAKSFPKVEFQPTEYDAKLLPSIMGYAADLKEHRIKTPLQLDATNQDHWNRVLQAGQASKQHTGGDAPLPSYDMVLSTNVIHISPWIV
ncbi:hypothetical protein BGZ94_001864, partial [Podila epigama]